MVVNPDSIPRYKEPTWAEYAEMSEGESKCESCDMSIYVGVNGSTRLVCVADHMMNGLPYGVDVSDERIDQCEFMR